MAAKEVRINPVDSAIFGSVFMKFRPFIVCAIVLLSMTFSSKALAVQIEEVQAQEAAQRAVRQEAPAALRIGIAQADAVDDEAATETKPDDTVVETTASQDDSPQISDQWAQLHLQDGSIIGGEIKTKSIDVKTAYGVLTVPIGRIVQIYPGLNSSRELNEKIVQLVEDLGGSESAARDKAQKELVSIGEKIRNVLREIGDGGNAERKKRLDQIYASLDEAMEEAMDELREIERSIKFDDTIVTPDFSIVGEIQQKEFQVASKFGQLKVNLGDIKLVDRRVKHGRKAVRKSVAVPARAFFQTKPQSTGIRVSKGDKISIRADGVVQWTNWKSSSSPEGVTNRSSWNGIHSGKLAARIGSDNSKCVQIGSKGDFIAKTSGILYLGIAMRDSYATNSGYNWTGEYKAKIVIKPK